VKVRRKCGPGRLVAQAMVEPLLRFMLLTLRAVAIATGMLDAMLLSTV
jgi:hypothetical protein